MGTRRYHSHCRSHWVVALGLLLGLFLPLPAGAQATAPNDTSEQVEAYVVALDQGELVLDLSSERGVKTGTVVEIWRPLVLKHPVTGAELVDRFSIGRLRVTQARDRVSLAKPVAPLSRPAQVGDIVVVRLPRRAAPSPQPAPQQATPATPTATFPAAASPPSDPEAAQLTALIDALRGTGLTERVAAYERFVAAHPTSRFNQTLKEEATWLGAQASLEQADRSDTEEVEVVSFAPPRQLLSGSPVTFAIELDDRAMGAVLHSRNPGEVTYVTTPMTPLGPKGKPQGYHSATIPQQRVETPWLEYFIEATTAEGKAVPVQGLPRTPLRVQVESLPEPKAPERLPVVASINTDYADWNRLRGNDVVWQTEGFVGMRLDDVGLRAVRTGFGVYRGTGGSLQELDEQGLAGRAVGLTYGYIEGEWGVSHFTGLVGRLVLGLGDAGVAPGAQFLLRLGGDRETNLLLGGEALGGIGLRSITQLELTQLERFPMLFRVEVTNQPAGTDATGLPTGNGALPTRESRRAGDVGARAIAQVGFRVLPEFVVAARASYQGRTIHHAGPGIGGGVTYQW